MRSGTDLPYNTNLQYYKSIPLRLIVRGDYPYKQAKRYTINGTNQNVCIPNKHLMDDGTIRPCEDIDYCFRRQRRQLELAGITWGIHGIKRQTTL